MRFTRQLLVVFLFSVSGCGHTNGCTTEVENSFVGFLRAVNLDVHDATSIAAKREDLRQTLKRCPDVESVTLDHFGRFSRVQLEIAAGDFPEHGVTGSQLNQLMLFAARYGNVDVIKKLIGLGANPNVTDEHGNTPLMNAVGGAQAHGENSCFLVTKGVKKELENLSGLTAAEIAEYERDTAAIECLK